MDGYCIDINNILYSLYKLIGEYREAYETPYHKGEVKGYP